MKGEISDVPQRNKTSFICFFYGFRGEYQSIGGVAVYRKSVAVGQKSQLFEERQPRRGGRALQQLRPPRWSCTRARTVRDHSACARWLVERCRSLITWSNLASPRVTDMTGRANNTPRSGPSITSMTCAPGSRQRKH